MKTTTKICLILLSFLSLCNVRAYIIYPQVPPVLSCINQPSIKLPLKNINVSIKIQENLARVEIEQEYLNDSEINLETQYLFPISESAVFDRFAAKIGNKILVGVIKEKAAAQKEYEENKAQGNTVAYSDIDSASPDIMRCKIGNLLPGQNIVIMYSYIEMLDVVMNSFWRLIVLSTLTERYNTESGSTASQITTVTPSIDTYKWTISAEINAASPITRINVPSHSSNVIITYSEDRKTAHIFLDPALSYNPNKDFEMYYSTDDDYTPRMVVERYTADSNDTVGYISFFPTFNSDSLDNSWQSYITSRLENIYTYFYSPNVPASSKVVEFIFIADRSGSMTGLRIARLKSALKQFITQIPNECYFNVISFGTNYELMFSKSGLKSELASTALSNIDSFEANFGGTEIYAPIQAAFNMTYVGPNIPRIIFILTDGDVGNQDQIIDLVKQNKSRARVNTIGIGSGASTNLVKHVAKAANGRYEFVSDTEDLSKKASYMIQNSISPYLTNFRLQFSSSNSVFNIQPRLTETPFILKDEPFNLLFGLKVGFPTDLSVKITYYDSYRAQDYSFDLKIDQIFSGTILHKFYAKRNIDDLAEIYSTDLSEINQLQVELSTHYQVLCDKTAFILVINENSDYAATPLMKVDIASIASSDYSNPSSSGYTYVPSGSFLVGAGNYIQLQLSFLLLLVCFFLFLE